MKIKIKEAPNLEALQFTGLQGEDIDFGPDDEAPEWLPPLLTAGTICIHPVWPDTRLQVTTRIGLHIVDEGDWIIRYEDGSLAVVKSVEFDENYEPA